MEREVVRQNMKKRYDLGRTSHTGSCGPATEAVIITCLQAMSQVNAQLSETQFGNKFLAANWYGMCYPDMINQCSMICTVMCICYTLFRKSK